MIFYDPWTALVVLLVALGLDHWVGEPFIYHPLVGFGRLAAWLGGILRREDQEGHRQYWLGVLAVTVLVIPFVALVAWLDTQVVVGAVVDILVLYLALSLRKLREDSELIVTALRAGTLPDAREQLGIWVHQNTADMDANELSRTSLESVLDNGNKAVLGSLFWFLLAGGAGVLLHRLANTLAVMWGYRIGPTQAFGRAAIHLDKLLNYLPAWLTVLSYAVVGRNRRAIPVARHQGRQWPEPNDGVVMAAGATVLGLSVGGGSVYGSQPRERPVLGAGRSPGVADIARALRLVGHSVQLLVWLQVLIAGSWSFV